MVGADSIAALPMILHPGKSERSRAIVRGMSWHLCSRTYTIEATCNALLRGSSCPTIYDLESDTSRKFQLVASWERPLALTKI